MVKLVQKQEIERSTRSQGDKNILLFLNNNISLFAFYLLHFDLTVHSFTLQKTGIHLQLTISNLQFAGMGKSGRRVLWRLPRVLTMLCFNDFNKTGKQIIYLLLLLVILIFQDI